MQKCLGLAGVLIGACCLASTTGCTQLTQAEIKMLETRELDLGYDQAYEAAANGLFSLGYTIEHSDKESGVLTGRRHDPQTDRKIVNALFFGVIGLAATGDRNEAVTFMLTDRERDQTQLRMKLIVNGQPIIDRKIMTQIWQQIEREAMLDSSPPAPPPAMQDEPIAQGIEDRG